MTPRAIEKEMIRRAGKTSDTKGERQFAEYAASRLLPVVHGANGEGVFLRFYDIVKLKFFTFQCDFLTLRFPLERYHIEYVGSYDVDFEIDGKGHKSKWDAWKDDLKAHDGIKVVHIPEAITAKKYWGYLDKELTKAFDSKEMIYHVPE